MAMPAAIEHSASDSSAPAETPTTLLPGADAANHRGRLWEPNNQGQIRVQEIDACFPAVAKVTSFREGTRSSARQEMPS